MTNDCSRREKILKPFHEKADFMNERVAAGIEANRKGQLELRVVDREGRPLPGLRLRLRQTGHAFKHGCNLFMLGGMESEAKEAAYRERFAEINNLGTLPIYWTDLEPEEGKLRFATDSPVRYRRPPVDLCLEYCVEQGIEPKAHCLNYDAFTPDWLPRDTVSVKRALERRFLVLAERYAGRIPGWEVTNETFWERGRTDFYWDPEMVEWSFRLAERCFPQNELIMNEATVPAWEPFHHNRGAYYMQIERALAAGVRIDTIGLQFHMFYPAGREAEVTPTFYDPERIFAVMDLYAGFGRPLQITEVTIPAYSLQAEDEELQAEIIRYLYSMWFAGAGMEAIVYWNLWDGYAYRAEPGDMSCGENYYHGGLLRFDGTVKPAFEVIRDLFGRVWRSDCRLESDSDGRAGCHVFYGDYEVEISGAGVRETRKLSFRRDGARDFELRV
ncbi:MAG: endo-1,4-beta-xylanase [Bacillota bacterium]|nr:endo-1,4-beta-xylanase [Bacillota bacterium]